MLDRASRFSLQGKRIFLASPASDFICGQVIFIDGGYSAV
jgi:enoyl-[acyl-carrier-protein] reductase (NADH)